MDLSAQLVMLLVLVSAALAAAIAGALTIASVRGAERHGWRAPRGWWLTAGLCGGAAVLLLAVTSFAQHL